MKRSIVIPFALFAFLITSLPLHAITPGPGSPGKLIQPSALLTLLVVIVIILICNYTKKQLHQRINATLRDAAPVNGIKIIAIKPYKYSTQISALDGYYVTIENRTITNVKERRSYSYTTAQAWEITVRNDSNDYWSNLYLQYGEYDKHGRVREGEYKQELISNLRPGETLAGSIRGQKGFDVVLENIRFIRTDFTAHTFHEVTYPVNLKMPKATILQFPLWIIAIAIAAGFCIAASNVFLVVMSVIAVFTAFFTFSFSTLGSVIMPLLLYAALTEDLTVVALLCGLFVGIDWISKKSWKDYFGTHHSVHLD